jgi:hypothetical protein
MEIELELLELTRDQLELSPAGRLSYLLEEDWPACREALQAAATLGDLARTLARFRTAGPRPRPAMGFLIAEQMVVTTALLGRGCCRDTTRDRLRSCCESGSNKQAEELTYEHGHGKGLGESQRL